MGRIRDSRLRLAAEPAMPSLGYPARFQNWRAGCAEHRAGIFSFSVFLRNFSRTGFSVASQRRSRALHRGHEYVRLVEQGAPCSFDFFQASPYIVPRIATRELSDAATVLGL